MTTQILELAIKFISPTTAIFNLLEENRKLKDGALIVTSNAIYETSLYCRYLELFLKRDLEREAQVAKCWSEAAIQMRHLDKKFASICDNKSEYWINPDNYTKDDVLKLGIGLKSVRQAYRKILN